MGYVTGTRVTITQEDGTLTESEETPRSFWYDIIIVFGSTKDSCRRHAFLVI